MLFTIIIVFFSLIILIILHELGHFIVARKFGVEVEEFGIFLPPRLYGKKIGETVYSINLIPLGAFVRVKGEEGRPDGIEDIRSFASKPIWQRVLIVAGGVISFWLVAAFLLSIVMGLGVPVAVSDEDNGFLQNPKVQITAVAPGSPAEQAGLKIGDTIKELRITEVAEATLHLPERSEGREMNEVQRATPSSFTRTLAYGLSIDKVKEVQEFAEQYKGKEVVLAIERGKDIFEAVLTPRVSPPSGQGAIGVALVRVAEKSYPWYLAPFKGIEATVKLTASIITGLAELLKSLFAGRGLPQGAELMGPVGIGALMTQFVQLGLNRYLHFIAVISIYLAVFNILPIPALDGGKLLFLGIEKFRGKPLNEKTEKSVTAFFFGLLLLLVVLVTIRDVVRLL